MELWHVVFWAVLSILLIIAEISTVQMVAVWFAVGGMTAFVSSLFGVPFYIQVILFIAGSVILLAATRPIVRRLLRNNPKVHTNADRIVGKECVVREPIDNLQGTGRVFADGLDWMARSTDDKVSYPAGSVCIIQEIQGVKVIVHEKPAAV